MMQSSVSSSAQPPAVYGLNNSMQASDNALSAAAAAADRDCPHCHQSITTVN